MDIYQSAPYLNFYSRLAVDLDLDAYKFIYTSGVGNKLKVVGGGGYTCCSKKILIYQNFFLSKIMNLLIRGG